MTRPGAPSERRAFSFGSTGIATADRIVGFRPIADMSGHWHHRRMADKWLSDIVVVNENHEEATAGDVSVFRSADDACSHLEHWWVQNGEGFAYTASGERLTLDVDGRDRVIVVDRQAAPHGPSIVRGWLHAYAAAVLEARRVKAARGKLALAPSEKMGQLPSSIEGLIAYVGFER